MGKRGVKWFCCVLPLLPSVGCYCLPPHYCLPLHLRYLRYSDRRSKDAWVHLTLGRNSVITLGVISCDSAKQQSVDSRQKAFQISDLCLSLLAATFTGLGIDISMKCQVNLLGMMYQTTHFFLVCN